MEKLTEKMVLAITEIAETNIKEWEILRICDKYKLSSAEENILFFMYHTAQIEVNRLLEQEHEELEITKQTDAAEHMMVAPIPAYATGFNSKEKG